jgi:hypothetical protein
MRRLQLLRPFSSEKELEDGRQRAEEVRSGSQGQSRGLLEGLPVHACRPS